MDLETLVLYRLAGKVELLYALKSVASSNLSYREASEKYGVSQGVVEKALRDICGTHFRECSRILPPIVDVVLTSVPSIATGTTCKLCGLVVLNVVLHIKKKHKDLLSYYRNILEEEVLGLLRRTYMDLRKS